MKSKLMGWIIGSLGVFFLISSLIITIVEYQHFKNPSASLPAGSTIAGVPVGGLDAETAQARLDEVYGLPLNLVIQDSTIAAPPADLGFEMDSASLVQQALAAVKPDGFWPALWNRSTAEPVSVPLEATVDGDKLRAYLLQEVEPRYTQSGTPLTPIPNTTNFNLSTAGAGLDLAQAIPAISAALLDPEIHEVRLAVTTTSAGGAPDWASLEAFLKHNIAWTGFDGLVEVYLEALDSSESLHFATWDGEDVAQDIAFPAASTIKIPIIISIFRHLAEPTPDVVIYLMEEMIANSQNSAADTLMQYYLDQNLGPLIVTEDLQALGLENTFLAGYFYDEAPLLRFIDTPANTRTDINLDPDTYNQMTPAELGQLLTGIYHCAADGSGLLTETFPGEITQSECQTMVAILSEPKPVQFLDTALPPEATVADKYGYASELDGLLHSITDAGIISTPGGDFVLVVSTYQSEWLYEMDATTVIGRLAQTVYNFFNPDDQAYWWFD